MAGTTDILRYWGLAVSPFDGTATPRFFYESASHAEALARLSLLVEDGGMGLGLLTGEPGSGKSFVAEVFARALDRRRFAPLYISSARHGLLRVLEELLCALGATPWCDDTRRPIGPRASGSSRLGDAREARAESYRLLRELRRVVGSRLGPCGLHLVVVLDEAQELSDDDLAELRCLPSSAGAPLTFVLVGQTELRDALRRLPALASRIGLGYHLTGLGAGETAGYLVHRLRAAGHPTGQVFREEAVEIIAERSGGSPREVNRLAKLCLYLAAAEGARTVSATEALSVAEDPWSVLGRVRQAASA